MKNKLFAVKGTPNLGDRKERTEEFTFQKVSNSVVQIKNKEDEIIISFNPFFDGGSIMVGECSSLIIRVNNWDDKNNKLKCIEEINTNPFEIQKWKNDSKKLQKLREAQEILKEDN